MTTPNLAKIERVDDLRQAWPNEASDFTPWLADNIAELGEALGMDLELQQREAPVGGFALDILATDVNQNRPVIIENQLEPTDHRHLGQLLTYAAGYDASVIVWLTREFHDEHRQALDWLNQRTDENTQFFGVVVELLRIGDSPLAPNFRLVVTPNEWRKEAINTSGETTPVSERGERYRAFFQSLCDTLKERGFTNARKALPQNWFPFSSGHGQRITYRAYLTRQKEAMIGVYIYSSDADWNTQLLESLESYKAEIESEIGEKLDWQRLESSKACRISLTRPGSIDDGADTLFEIRAWMVEYLLKFKVAFSPKLAD